MKDKTFYSNYDANKHDKKDRKQEKDGDKSRQGENKKDGECNVYYDLNAKDKRCADARKKVRNEASNNLYKRR